jgi:NAD(P)-dependent dehydrogenase (short-subunit alcohol dehydrogenase family)
MSVRLAQKVALVTGSGQGVGRGIALALAAEGAAVVLNGRREQPLRDVAAQIDARGGRALPVVGDVSVREDVEMVVARAAHWLGRLDILVNNAQSSVQRLLEETSDADVAMAYLSGPLATLHCMQAALPHFKERGAGCIVNLGSSAATLGRPEFGSYAMAKEAIRGVSRVAAREWGRYGVRVNVVCPAASTPAADEYLGANPNYARQLTREIPLGRLGDPERDIGRAVAALASDDLAYLTGATLMLEGGRTLLA